MMEAMRAKLAKMKQDYPHAYAVIDALFARLREAERSGEGQDIAAEIRETQRLLMKKKHGCIEYRERASDWLVNIKRDGQDMIDNDDEYDDVRCKEETLYESVVRAVENKLKKRVRVYVAKVFDAGLSADQLEAFHRAETVDLDEYCEDVRDRLINNLHCMQCRF